MVFTLLREYGAHAISRHVSLEEEGFVKVRLRENGTGAHSGFELFECFVLWFPPVPDDGLFCKV